MDQGKLFRKALPIPLDPPPLFLIDGSSFIYRAYFAIQGHLSTSKGLPTKAIFGLAQMLFKLLREWNPQYIALCFDAKGPTFRHQFYEEYKANRPPMPEDLAVQIPYIKELSKAFGLPQLEIEGFEADDIIATVAKKFDFPIVIVGGDKDLFPLLSKKVFMWDPMKGKFITYEEIKKSYGIEPERLLDVRALAGDKIDNIPGIPGIGEKTALKLVKMYGSLENIYRHITEIKQKRLREKLLKFKEQAFLSYKLVRLKEDASIPLDLDFYRRKPLETSKLRKLFRELEFKKLLKELPPEKVLPYENYYLIDELPKLLTLLEKIKKAKTLVLDIESNSLDPHQGNIVGIALCFSPPEAYYVIINHQGLGAWSSLGDKGLKYLKNVLEDPSIPKVGHNIKYDFILLKRHGIHLKGLIGDTMVASYVLNPIRRTHSLDELAEEILGHRMISYKEVTSSLSKEKSFAFVDIEKAKIYACEDAHVTYLLFEYFWPRLKEEGLWPLYKNIEHPLIEVLAKMEMAGVKIDVEYLQKLSQEINQELSQIQEKIFSLVGESFNLNSSLQLGKILFEKFKLPKVKKTRKKQAYSTDTEVLEILSEYHELPRLVLKYRTLTKLKSTYIDSLPKLVNPKTGRIHTSFNQTITSTGRLSSSDPNLQNIPVRGEEGLKIRQAFIPEKNHIFLSADYSQIDLRVLAHYSQDKTLLEAFSRGEDIHKRTAAEIWGISPSLVTSDMRRIAKTINFGIVYGMSPYGLAKELKISRKKAQEFIKRYFERYPGVKKYMQEIIERARKQGFVTTLLGRKRYLPDINSPNRRAREFAERTAINTPIQGTAADIIKLAMIEIDRIITSQKLKTKMLLQVHDELLFEIPVEELEEIKKLVRDKMERVVKLDVPLKVDIAIGKNWAEAKK